MPGARGSRGGRGLLLVAIAVLLGGGCNSIFGIRGGQGRPTCVDPQGLLIDDMEDGDVHICNLNMRQGAWYTVGDGTPGAQVTAGSMLDFKPTLIPKGRGDSRYAARFTGSGFTNWGALMGVNLNVVGLSMQPYDAGTTGGIKFWMKSDAAVSVDFLISETELPIYGGSCDANATPSNCNSHFSFQITTPGPGWVEYYIPFKALTQKNGGSATWNPRFVLGLQFVVNAGAPFDVWIDDLSFYYCATSQCTPTCTDPDLPKSCPADEVARLPAACRPDGTDCAAVTSWCSDVQMIDDMEDGTVNICATGGRHGTWYTVGDGTSTNLIPAPGQLAKPALIPGGRGVSHYAAHATGSGFTGWGALMGFGLNAQTAPPKTYDASTAGGIRFWLKNNNFTTVSFSIPETIPASRGGMCIDFTPNCDNKFSYSIPPTPPDEWVEYSVPFTALRQHVILDANGHLQRGTAIWDASKIVGIEFASGASFDLWVDDVRFFNCMGDACVPTCSASTEVACPASGVWPAACWPAGTDCANPPGVMSAGVWGSGPDDVWAVGNSAATLTGTILHWDGSTWTPTPTPSDLTPALFGVWGSGAKDIWAIGVDGTLLHYWDGSWSAVASGTTSGLYNGVWGTGPGDVWAAGAAGTIVHWDGTQSSLVPSGTIEDLWGVWGTSPTNVWAAGGAGTILRWDGSAWSKVPSGTTAQLDGVWASGASDAWAVGDGGAILHWDGLGWTPVPSTTTKYLDGVWGSAPNDVWAVGEGGTIVHWDGAAWMPVPSGTTNYLAGVWGSGPNDVWAVGDFDTILHWNGNAWSPTPVAPAP